MSDHSINAVAADVFLKQAKAAAEKQLAANQSCRLICPHCGMEPHALADYHAIPEHSFEGRKCPGSGQHPRNKESDRRPLWKDECPRCEGTGSVDSGGFTPWGEPVNVPCPECTRYCAACGYPTMYTELCGPCAAAYRALQDHVARRRVERGRA